MAIAPVYADEVGDAGRGYYQQEMRALRGAIQEHFFDQASGHYLGVVDPAAREVNNGYLREYTYLWSLCALYQAANEMEKVDPRADLMGFLVKEMAAYYDPAPPVPGYSDYIMQLKPGERYYDDNQWIGITALDAFARTQRPADLELGKSMYDFMMVGQDDALGGGIYWKGNRSRPGVLIHAAA